jgi:diaminohydroxyphosphoribosylaminopyrimidine deaminase / 5-amino-6-(5-phosphoribosylamino)uracil reductase
MNDNEYMQQALALAAQAQGCVSPNPLVGALVVREGKIVGQGVHFYATRKHAEVWALEQAGEAARGATLYVTLEPCCHYGRTPPCTTAVINSGIERVVIATIDPNRQVAGKGVTALQTAGIAVTLGVAELAARRLNEKFITYMERQRPFVHLKVAMTLDGKIATVTGQSKWITGAVAREAAHRLRAEHDAILVGARTVRADDPALTIRLDSPPPRHRPLIRVVLDPRLSVPLNSQLVQTALTQPVIIFALTPMAQNQHKEQFTTLLDLYTAHGVEVVCLPDTQLDLSLVLANLAERRITSLLVEGGSEVNGLFLQAQLIDRVTFFIAPKLLGGRQSFPAIGGVNQADLSTAMKLQDWEVVGCGDDLAITARCILTNDLSNY